ncbi:MAG: septal ring lytic transglycosylase RlpA family protein [Candidatus Obscuribacterales bacterium]|nr:septal ring lytic transglycosylase RlpA family protein [Candidatus Obscuribacterales bacterium]
MAILNFLLLFAVWMMPASAIAAGANSSEPDKSFSGNSSWYGIPFHGRKTASGEIFNMNKLSAAHKTFPLPTYCLVEDPRSGNTVIVKVNDRGPYAKGRVMDLSREAARQLGTLSRGVAYIEGTVLGRKAPATASSNPKL